MLYKVFGSIFFIIFGLVLFFGTGHFVAGGIINVVEGVAALGAGLALALGY